LRNHMLPDHTLLSTTPVSAPPRVRWVDPLKLIGVAVYGAAPALVGFDRRGLRPRVLLRPLNLIDVIYRDFRSLRLAFAPHADEGRLNASGRAVRRGTDDMRSSGVG
jgi:hypothetical protein